MRDIRGGPEEPTLEGHHGRIFVASSVFASSNWEQTLIAELWAVNLSFSQGNTNRY